MKTNIVTLYLSVLSALQMHTKLLLDHTTSPSYFFNLCIVRAKNTRATDFKNQKTLSLLRNGGEEDEEEEESGSVADEGREGGDLQEEVFEDQHHERGQQRGAESGSSEKLQHAGWQKVGLIVFLIFGRSNSFGVKLMVDKKKIFFKLS